MTDDQSSDVIESALLPRELLPGLTWLGACIPLPYENQLLHGYHSVYVLEGESAVLIVDTGHPKDWGVVERELDEVLSRSDVPVRYLFPTHSETPHCGNLGRLLGKYPDAEVVGDTRDYHLVFPDQIHRFHAVAAGDHIDLGGRTFEFVEAVIRDLETTLWGYDQMGKALFTSDGFAYMHHHRPAECGLVAEETPNLPFGDFSMIFNEYALYWTQFTDLGAYFDRIDCLMDSHPTELIAPAHGSPIADPSRTVSLVRAGVVGRFGNREATERMS
jgi:flavorubredoxin